MNHHRIPGFAAEQRLPAFLLLLMIAMPGQRALAQFPPPADLQQEQSLSLFEPVAGSEQTERPVEQRSNAEGGPTFTLLGTSRIGSKYTVVLAHRDGSIARVSADPGSTAEIPDYPGYRLVGIGSRQVSLITPGSDPCVDQQDRGVSCSDIGVTQLALATAAPIAVPAQGDNPDASANAASADPNAAPENPFAAAVRMAREAEANGQPRRRRANPEDFQPRRIAPEDVPAGMRVVRTPFGDRMVPDSPQ